MKIVVRGTNWVGDAVMTIPALRELRRIFPNAKIALHTRDWAEGIFRDADFIDEILPFQPAKSALKTTFSQAKVWREKKFDLAVLFTNSFESALLAKLGKVPKRFGFAKEGRSFLLSNSIKIPVWKNERHEIFYYLELISEIENEFFGTKTVLDRKPELELKVSDERKKSAKKILSENGVDLNKNIIVFVAGSTNSRAKRWNSANFSKLNDKLQNETDSEVILIGAENELDVSLKVYESSKFKPVILTGKTTLSEVTSILSICDLTVSNDTGPAHISAALGTKTLVLFGPTNPKTTQPLHSEIIKKDVSCAPCMLRDCPIDHRCMTRISPEEVFEKAVSMLKSN